DNVRVRRRPAGDALRRVAARDLEKDQIRDEADGDQDDDHPEHSPDKERHHLGPRPPQRSILTFARGSSASRNPSPKTLSEMTVMVIMMPGSRESQGSLESTFWPSAIIVPQAGFGGCTRAPRDERANSVRLAFATTRVNR